MSGVDSMLTKTNIATAVLVTAGFASLFAFAQQSSPSSAEQRLKAAMSSSGAAVAEEMEAELEAAIEKVEELKQALESDWIAGEDGSNRDLLSAYGAAIVEADAVFTKIRASPENLSTLINYAPSLEDARRLSFVTASDYWQSKSPKPASLTGPETPLESLADRAAATKALDRVGVYRDQIDEARENNNVDEATRLYRATIELLISVFGLNGSGVWYQRQEFAQFLLDQDLPHDALDQLWPLLEDMREAGAAQSDMAEVRSLVVEAGENILWRSAMSKSPAFGGPSGMLSGLTPPSAATTLSYSCRVDFLQGVWHGRDVATKCSNGKIVTGPDLKILEPGFNCANFDIATADLIASPMGLTYTATRQESDILNGVATSTTTTVMKNIMELGETRFSGQLLLEESSNPKKNAQVTSGGFCVARASSSQEQ